MEINQERLWERIHQLAKIGIDPLGGVTRWAYTEEDMQAKEWLIQEMKTAGLEVKEDQVGDVIGIYNPTNSTEAPVLSGSHFDTVRNAGIFDGCLGTLAALEVAQTLKENQVMLKRPLYIIGYRDEEGNRFNSGMIGSKMITSKAEAEDFESKDEKGITMFDAMKQCGYHPEDYKNGRISPIHASVELHIEQGKVLEQNECGVGIVEGIPYLRFYEITLGGCSGHAGATPMNDRQDPVVAMCKWIQKITELAESKPFTVATVGNIKTVPGSTNVICDHVTFSLDIRSLVEENIDLCMQQIAEFQKELEEIGITISCTLRHILYGVTCDEKQKCQLEEIMQNRNYPYLRLMSGAGHDTQNFKDVCPCSMIFVRSVNGYSHRKEEFTSKEDCVQGTTALLDLVERLCNE